PRRPPAFATRHHGLARVSWTFTLCLQSRPVAEASTGCGVAMSEISPRSIKTTKIEVTTGIRNGFSTTYARARHHDPTKWAAALIVLEHLDEAPIRRPLRRSTARAIVNSGHREFGPS